MKRILSGFVALTAVLVFGSVSRATLVTYDLSAGGSSFGSVQTVSSFAPSPGFFITPFDVGSNVVLDFEGSSVSLVSGTFNINSTEALGFLGDLITNVQVTLGPATGTLNGNQILWNTPGSTLTTAGTFQCTAGVCTLTGLTEGTAYPIAQLQTITGTTAVNPVDLGTWGLDPGLHTIRYTTRVVDQLGGASPPPGQGLPAQWYVIGPEPSTLALVLLGLGVVRLRSRRA